MFIYELLMLKIPYEGTATFAGSNINIRGHVLAGGRPPITNKVSHYLLPFYPIFRFLFMLVES
jgi:hypothetical protein